MPKQPTAQTMPRLFEALGLSPERVREEVAQVELDDDARAGVAYWLPTKESISAAGRGQPHAAAAAAGADALGGPASQRTAAGGAGAHAREVAAEGRDTADRTGESRSGGEDAAPRRGRRARGSSDPVGASGLRRVVELPAALRDARTAVSLRAVMAIALVVVLAGGIFAFRLISARAAAAPTPVPTAEADRDGAVVGRSSVAFASEEGAGTTPPTPGASGTATAASVVVDVVGQVRRPGVVRLSAGSRVVDAIKRAGGAVPGADVAAINLARVLVDGEQIRVPKPGEAITPSSATSGAVGSGTGVGSTSGSGTAGDLININTADVATLDGLPGVGPVLAQRILDWRTENGHFTSLDDLGEVSGIGEKLLAQIKPRASL